MCIVAKMSKSRPISRSEQNDLILMNTIRFYAMVNEREVKTRMKK